MRRKLTISALLLMLSIAASAQFALSGDDPGNLKWKQIRTPHYQVIFPSDCDSLGRVFAQGLEYWYPRVSATIGTGPNENYKRPLPVILHTRTAASNGVVTWLPRRIDLYTVPDASSPLPMKWEDQLIAHESRHAAQMQIGHHRKYKVFNVLLGDLFPGAMAALYGGPAFFEGDAVVTETELTGSGRGRNGAFLEYYRYSAINGDFRDFWQWRYGSQNKYSPDHYRAGYFGITAVRTQADDPLFTKRFYDNISGTRWPFPLFTLNKTTRQATGKTFNRNFTDATRVMAEQWKREAAARAPFTEADRVTSPSRLHSEFTNLCLLDGRLYAVRNGLDRTAELVNIGQDGTIKRICTFSSSANHLRTDESRYRIYWSENKSDHRWSLKSESAIRFLDAAGEKQYLTRHGRLYNPSVNPATGQVVAVEYPYDGGSAIVTIDPENGKIVRKIKAPDGLQVTDCAFTDGRMVAVGITSSGAGLFAPEENWATVMEECNAAITNIFERNGTLYFTSDRDGTDELYSFSEGKARRITSHVTGADWFCFHGDTLYFSALTEGGRMVMRTSSLQETPVNMDSVQAFPEAEKLSAQYRSLTSQPERTQAVDDTTAVPESEPYSKLANLFRFHSWAPVFINYDAVADMSAESLSSAAALGATAFFQNSLSSASGYVGAAFRPSSGWRPELHARFTYTGLYPVFELSADFNEREAFNYYPAFLPGRTSAAIQPHNAGLPSLAVTAKTYIPFNLSSGGWTRGVIPQFSASFSNDRYSNGTKMANLTLLNASLRAYTMRPVAPSCIYPRLGIGAEIGYSGYAGMSNTLKPTTYFFAYGYIPGIIRTHGVKLTALYRQSSYSSARFTADYAFPFAAVDWSFLGPFAYIRNFECTLHGILYAKGGVSTVGADICARIGNLLWIPYDTRLGISVTYAPSTGKAALGMVLSVDL